MAKSKPIDRGKRKKRKTKAHKTEYEKRSPEDLLFEAYTLQQESQLESALPLAQRALVKINSSQTDRKAQLPALLLLAQIFLDLGASDEAYRQYLAAIEIDSNGENVGAEPFLWLAQLCEEGGQESISWFEKGLTILREEIVKLEATALARDDLVEVLSEKKQKMVDSLCGMAEVYMTDLSLEPTAESKCEAFVTEALLLNPDSSTALQTLANVRISQLRYDEARSALQRSMASWCDAPSELNNLPEFSSRISLSRLLMEVEMEGEALAVLERLVQEEDQSVEAWYLGGWCQYLQSQKGIDVKSAATEWLRNSLRLYEMQDYEDIRLREHAKELVRGLGLDPGEDGSDGSDGDEWEDDVDVDDDYDDIEVEEAGNVMPASMSNIS
ncbi:MAG: hypothetical protein Q9160_007929 [Pyrenula sp. 1 TL-2023]